jgi:multisubunit Na+/H+ antiporter MnhC subunit
VLEKLRHFLEAESGAVTVDWVVLTAVVIGLGMSVLIPIGFSADEGAQRVGVTIREIQSGYGRE